MSRKILLWHLPLSIVALGCGSSVSAVRTDPGVPEREAQIASSAFAPDVEIKAPLPAVTEMQSHAKAKAEEVRPLEGGAPRAQASQVSAPPAPEFPDRQAIEALDHLSRTVPLDIGKQGAATIRLQSDDYFEPGSPKLNESSWRLNEIAQALALQSGRSIAIRVYTDSLGDRSQSMKLSQDRAAALRDYFVGKGVPIDRLRVEGLGPDHPVAENSTSAGRASNRRIELVIEVNHDSLARR